MEFFDICDNNGIPTGKIVDRETAHREGICHRTAHIWVVQKIEGRWQVLLQQRSWNKDSFPGQLDTSSAGHIPAGDEPVPSALRELYEELGITAAENELVPIGQFHGEYEKVFHEKVFKDNEIVHVYVFEKSVDIDTIHIQEEELEAVGWYDFEETYDRCEKKDSRYCVPMKGLNVLKRYLDGVC